MSAAPAQDSTPSVITPTYYGADLEKAQRIQRVITPGGHPADYSQPGFPHQHRRVGNPMPAGLLSFASLFLLFGLYGLGAHHVRHPNVVVPLLVFYGGVCQNLIGWFEMFIGNTFSATIVSVLMRVCRGDEPTLWPASCCLAAPPRTAR